MIVHAPLVYVDTSVYGGVFDDEYARPSQRFLSLCLKGVFRVATSDVVKAELSRAPNEVFSSFQNLVKSAIQLPPTVAAEELMAAFLQEGIVGPKSMTDALHVATAVCGGCSMIVSWNFSHIVHFQKVPLYNAISVLRGYNAIGIHSPLEVIDYE